ncbi:TetR/AcrR family transcriptional regulator [Nannocystis bainbridge]|uniref:TetR/AcrR family transcriptional regulator n=1 Tax=Nannocystis bainbridge TaxID=2995303 RepID=A0ABT5E8Q2_9BACT|nr:TetR/AcrR family transcriptional regulator [Nannocystis bainbridge]MDC0722234.1 TetR/AcrR family transcriptional regulator [Nannocystis bainbridge]
MTSPIRHTPRKQPRQARSQQMVDTLLDAAVRVLGERGLEATTTNEIARVAGVSVGSLYQYFPSKEAMLAAALDRKFTRGIERVFEVPAPDGGSFAEQMRDGLRAAIDLYRGDLEFFRAVLLHVPRVGRVEALRAHVHAGRERLRDALIARSAELRPVDPELAAFVIVSAIEWVILTCVLEQPERLSDPRLVEELIALVGGYLAPRPGP